MTCPEGFCILTTQAVAALRRYNRQDDSSIHGMIRHNFWASFALLVLLVCVFGFTILRVQKVASSIREEVRKRK